MWALRRVSTHSGNRVLRLEATQICCIKSEISKDHVGNLIDGFIEPQENKLEGFGYLRRFHRTPSSLSKSYMAVRCFTSQAIGDSEDAFPELKTPYNSVQAATSRDEIDDELVSESENSEDEIDDESVSEPENSEHVNVAQDMPKEMESLGTVTDDGEKGSTRDTPVPAMVKAILAAPDLSAGNALDRWVEEGNEVIQTDVVLSMLYLRKRRMFVKALQLSEWVESTKHLEFLESNYASRVDLIAKTQGIYKAEEYLKKIPESFRGEMAHRTLLANCVHAANVKKSEDVFNKMKDLFPLSCFSCNQMLFLYKRTDGKKIAEILLLMEKEKIKPSGFTYEILIDIKGQYKEIVGMEQIVERMKSEGIEPYTKIQTILAQHYAAAGLKDKADALLKEIEGDDLSKKRQVCQYLLPIYASLGEEDEVARIWKLCESEPRLGECLAAIRAWGQLNRIEDAEAAFEKMCEKVKRLSFKRTSRHYVLLLNVYANHKMLQKGEDLARRMAENSIHAGPPIWDALVNLYVRAGEMEKADSVLEKAINKKRARPLYTSFMTILDQYSKRGDVHNAEKILLKMREARYALLYRPYHLILQSYINAKAPAYGFRERLKGDKIIPNKDLVSLMAKADAFRKSPLSELLE